VSRRFGIGDAVEIDPDQGRAVRREYKNEHEKPPHQAHLREGIMPSRDKLAALAIALPLLALESVGYAQQPAGDADAEYTMRAITAASLTI
jgi:hypothetical protein